ncbi:hypothetical protein AB0L00_41690 [Actinoallomurus sp. NPDC052308]|uniref:hypothetical protein n=1 Tax=Actinoallomurus sp. NPDC052308 TaxID=3155530 RepID=UPI00341A2696
MRPGKRARRTGNGHKGLAYVPVTGLPDSTLGLIWRRDNETARVRAFAKALADVDDSSQPGAPAPACTRLRPPPSLRQTAR